MVSKEEVLSALKNVYDPEIPVNIVDLGLIYKLDIDEESGTVNVLMTLTAPGCPMGNYILSDAEVVLKSVDGVKDVKIELTYDPPWSPDMMSEEAKKELGYT
ncbi:MAG: metal-sulfur cluster assembly factor [Caldisericaceae bacterium]